MHILQYNPNSLISSLPELLCDTHIFRLQAFKLISIQLAADYRLHSLILDCVEEPK